MNIAPLIKASRNLVKQSALGLAAAAILGIGVGSAQSATTTIVIDLGSPGNGTYFPQYALVSQISQGTLPVGSILRSVTLNYTLEGGAPYLGDLAPLFADSNGDNGVLLIAGDPNDGGFPKGADTTVSWNSGGDYSVGATASATLTAADGILPIDLNSYTVWLEIQGYDGTLSGSVTLEYDIPSPAVIASFGPGAVIDQGAKTISWVLPYGSSLTQAPTYTLTSGSCLPVSSPLPAIDFSDSVAHPVTYTVTDGETENIYAVTVTVASPPDELNVSTYIGRDSVSDLDPISNLMAVTPSATATTTAKINYHGNTFATLPGAPGPEHFSVLWEGWFDVTKDGRGVYTFGTSSDDGSVLYLDLNNDGDFADAGELIVSNNKYQGDNAITAEVDLQVDMVHMVIGFYQGTGGYDMRAAFKKGSGLGFGALDLINSSSGYFFAAEPGPPPAPTGLTAASLYQGIRLDWTASTRATGYNVYRGTETGIYAPDPLGTTTSATTYNDMDASTGGPYFYVVKATNAKGAGEPSNEASASPSAETVDQTITFALGLTVTKTAADVPFADTATAFPSGLPVTYSVPVEEQTVATVDANTGVVTLTGLPGTAHVVADIAASTGFNAAQATQTLTVNQAIPVITWATPVPIQLGTLLSDTQLNASSGGVEGSFVYTPPSGTELALGTHTLSVQFTPTETVKYSTPAAKTVELLVVPVETTVIWNAVSGTWDTSTANWKGNVSGEPTIFTQGNSVIFDKTDGGTITLAAGMEPLATTVSAVSGNYEFSGAPLAGTGSLTKSGDGTLKVDGLNPNTYSGGTIMNGGTLWVGTMVAGISPLCTGVLGTGPVTLNGGTMLFDRVIEANDLIVNGGTLYSQNGWGAQWNGPITLNATLTCNTGWGMTIGGAMSGVGGLLKTGNNTLMLSGINTFTGTTTINQGTLKIDVAGQLASSSVVINAGTSSTNFLMLTTSSSLAETVTLTIEDGGAQIDIPSGVTQTVTALYLGSDGKHEWLGTWGPSSSAAVNKDDEHFTATSGILRVLTGMQRGTVIIIE